MDWENAEGLLLCWMHSLDFLWCSDPSFECKYELCDVHCVGTYRHRKCSYDGKIWSLLLIKLTTVEEI